MTDCIPAADQSVYRVHILANTALERMAPPGDLCRMHIEHLALWVRDLERMRLFYQTYFGATSNEKYVNTTKNFSSYFLTFPDAGPRLELMQMPGIPATQNDAFAQFSGFIHIAISVGSDAAVNELTERLRTDGYLVVGEPRLTGDGYYESVVLDPELNRIELTS